MASPSFIAACCLGNDSALISGDIPPHSVGYEEKVVSVVSLVFAIGSSVSIQILLCPWQRIKQNQLLRTEKLGVQNKALGHIMTCIIISGILANVGIIMRSSARISDFYPQPSDMNYGDSKHVFCILSSVWVQYFFLCVIFWHLVYGLESYMISKGQSSSQCIQHFLGWVIPAAICSLGAWVVYQQTDKGNLVHLNMRGGSQRYGIIVLVNHLVDLGNNEYWCGARQAVNLGILYLILLTPVVVVLVLLLCLFYKSTTAVRRFLIHNRGTYSTSEREIVNKLQIKFILIILAFTVCWIPNILNGIFVNVITEKSGDLILVFHVLQSVLNPCQVLIDTLVLYGWSSLCCRNCTSMTRTHGYQPISSGNINDLQGRQGSEVDPLLSFSNNRATL